MWVYVCIRDCHVSEYLPLFIERISYLHEKKYKCRFFSNNEKYKETAICFKAQNDMAKNSHF